MFDIPRGKVILGENTMLQIIGWIMCLYLVVKACELLSMDTDEHRFSRHTATAGAVTALIGAAGFLVLINQQVSQSAAAQDQMNASISNLTR